MTDWKTIKVPPADKDRADAVRPDDSTWADCVLAGAEELAETPTTDATDDLILGDGYEAIATKIAESLADRVEATGGISERDIAREVSKHLDYVELADQVADELEVRLG